MLHLVRKHADSWMVKGILWLIVFAFVGTIFYSWGMGGASASRGGVVATVEGEEIHFNEYQTTFDNLVNLYRNQFKSQFNEELIERLDLKTAALDGLIQRKLLLLEAQKQNINVSDDELINHIQKISAFQRDNKFNRELYNNYIRFSRTTPREFEEDQRETLLMAKVEQLIKDNVKVSEAEMMEAFKEEEEKVKFDYFAFPDNFFISEEPVTEEEKKAFYEINKTRFKIPEQVNVQYIKVTPESYEAEMEPREEDIQDYYEENIAKYRIEERFKASHILFNVEPESDGESATDEEKKKKLTEAEEAAKKKADEVLKKIKAGADFGEMAKEFSDDKASGNAGGDLGQFPRGVLVSEFEKALDDMKVGDISDEPVLTSFGYHIIRLDEKIEERIQPLSEVKESVVEALKKIKAQRKVRRIVKRIHKAAQKDGNIDPAAKEENIEVKSTGFFSFDKHDLPEIGNVPEFFNLASTLVDNQLSAPLHTAEASYLLKIVDRKPARIPELSEVESQIVKAIKRDKNKKLTAKKAKAMSQKLAEKNDIEKIAGELELEVLHTPFFSLGDSIPGIGNLKPIKDKVFGLDKGETTMVKARNKYYLIRLADRIEPGTPDEISAKNLYSRLRKTKGEAFFQAWLKNLRKDAEILLDKSFL